MINLDLYSKQIKMLAVVLLLAGSHLFAQVDLPPAVSDSSEFARQYMKQQAKSLIKDNDYVVAR